MNRMTAFAFAGVGAMISLLIIISAATPAWLEDFGIWTVSGTAKIHAVRAFVLLGLSAEIAAIVLCVLLAVSKITQKLLAIVFFAIAGGCLFAALVIFADLVSNIYGYYGHSYTVGWIACIFSFLTAAALALVEKFIAYGSS